MTQQQRNTVAQILRNAPLELGGEVAEQRERFRDLVAANPVPGDVTIEPISLGGVPALAIAGPEGTANGTVLYFHGGGFVVGSARASAGLAASLAARQPPGWSFPASARTPPARPP
ncbi:hypothetical protein [Streptantibioticus ferralitis]|uniref:Alpha/beta hydrolase fold-3 domain-containing protein n=1 Tax=Streptantibioticus ferralitis TaxID=236510 RepID=A0ABT5ZB79_9ACTN|nr:hypothetical protein [Streptantibioticus ferralitis]MDF2260882.1 hypothetical protein [Streptantibioticus ferralitis]